MRPSFLLATLVLACSLLAGAAQAQPRCERARGTGPWPALGQPEGAAPATPLTVREARALVRRFRRGWARPGRRCDLVPMTLCVESSFEHFVVRRVATAAAQRRIDWLRSDFTSEILVGGALTGDWVYEVYWGGASLDQPPNGAINGFIAADGRTLLAAVHWPEG